MYSLLSRNINLRPDRRRSKQLTRLESDSELRFYGSTTKQTRSSSMNAKALKFIEESRFAQKLLMWLVMLGTCMVIGDGVLTPAISGKQNSFICFFYAAIKCIFLTYSSHKYIFPHVIVYIYMYVVCVSVFVFSSAVGDRWHQVTKPEPKPG